MMWLNAVGWALGESSTRRPLLPFAFDASVVECTRSSTTSCDAAATERRVSRAEPKLDQTAMKPFVSCERQQ